MAKRTEKIGAKYTKEESDWIREQAEKNKISCAEYIRRKVLWLPPEIHAELEELNYQVRKIGVNINQIARSCNSRKFVTSGDYRDIIGYLGGIDQHICNLEKKMGELCEKRFQMDLQMGIGGSLSGSDEEER